MEYQILVSPPKKVIGKTLSTTYAIEKLRSKKKEKNNNQRTANHSILDKKLFSCSALFIPQKFLNEAIVQSPSVQTHNEKKENFFFFQNNALNARGNVQM